MTPMKYTYAIIGGGLAAGYAAQVFAEADLPAQDVAIFAKEAVPPYERPPLSKDFLAGEETAVDTLINEFDFYTENNIKLYLNTPVERVDLDQRQLLTREGVVEFEKLLITTGSKPRKFDLPGSGLADIYYLRHISTARQLKEKIKESRQAVVIGGSFIGMEVASVLAQSGVKTTLTFPESRVWEAFFTPRMSQFFANYYEQHDVTILPNSEITGFRGKNGRVAAVQLAQHDDLPADLVVAGIGVTPNIAIFEDTPLKMNEGILVNRFLETNIRGVFAAGDVAEYRDVLANESRRLEHWDNAYQQGQHAARMMLGEMSPYKHVPYFFSDVFDLSYEFWGDPQATAVADTIIHRGEVEKGQFSVWWLRNNQLQAAFVMNRPDEEREAAPEWIASGITIDADRLANAERPLSAATEKTIL